MAATFNADPSSNSALLALADWMNFLGQAGLAYPNLAAQHHELGLACSGASGHIKKYLELAVTPGKQASQEID